MIKKTNCTKRKITLHEEKKEDGQKERKINLVLLFLFLKITNIQM